MIFHLFCKELMMYGVPDTAFGAAVAQFLLLFQKRPATLAQLHAAFADMAAIAARDHPEMPWPLKQNDGDGQASTFTVEGWLAVLRSNYSRLLVSDDTAIAEKLMLWNGAIITATVTSSPWPTELQLHFTKRIRTETGKTRAEQLGALVISCSWILLQDNVEAMSSADIDSQTEKTLLVILKGLRVLDIRVERGGVLVVGFNKGVEVAVQPNDFSVGPDYSLFMVDDDYFRFNGNFVVGERGSQDESDEAAPAS